jgi:hypothetical protein
LANGQISFSGPVFAGPVAFQGVGIDDLGFSCLQELFFAYSHGKEMVP